MHSNYDDVLTQLKAFGLKGRGIDDGLQVGRMVRCQVEGDRERRGWYILHELHLEAGDVLLVGSFGQWHGNDNGAQKLQLKKSEVSAEQLAAMKARWAEDKKKAEAARRGENDRAAEKARVSWTQGIEVDDNQYLARKSVNSYGLKQTPGGVLMIPMLDTSGKIHGLQLIRNAADAKASQRPEKEFWPAGLAKKGHFFQIGTPDRVVLVAEGYATAASLHAATGLPVVVAFDANNLAPVSAALRKRYKGVKVLICADDDAFARCPLLVDGAKCSAPIVLAEHPSTCPQCGGEHKRQNTGVSSASAAALEVDGAFIRPVWSDEARRTERFRKQGHKHSDFNDLHVDDGLQAVRTQVEAALSARGWLSASAPSGRKTEQGGGVAKKLKPIVDLQEMLDRYVIVYGLDGGTFDRAEHSLVSEKDVRRLCSRDMFKFWSDRPDREIARTRDVGFDPTENDKQVTCNLWAGWPTTPKAGKCEKLLEVLRDWCSGEKNSENLYQWVLRWSAYPIQHPGAKMKTTIVVHGLQGTGKNIFFEALMGVYGQYGRIIDQGAIEDKFNDWASKKLFLIADEVIASNDLYHIKNKLKSLITGQWIRINPKNVGAYDERNHVNMVFLSNETKPVILEEDDRRHVIIWTPPPKSLEFFASVKKEIDDGGIEALHDYLLHLDLGDFSEASPPPMTAAKDELINLSLDSTTKFFYALLGGDMQGVELIPGLAEDYYQLYKAWCVRNGIGRVAPLARLVNTLTRKHGITAQRKRYYSGQNLIGPHSILIDKSFRLPEGKVETVCMGEFVERFKSQLEEYRGTKWRD